MVFAAAGTAWQTFLQHFLRKNSAEFATFMDRHHATSTGTEVNMFECQDVCKLHVACDKIESEESEVWLVIVSTM